MATHKGIKDSGAYFVIDHLSRKVTVPHAHKSIGTVGDHKSEQITFECPQTIDGHDVSQCKDKYVTWVNAKGRCETDVLELKQVEHGAEGMIYLSWTIRNPLTEEKGLVQFSVHFEDVDENGTQDYQWSTTTCKDCDILESINSKLATYKAIYVSGDTLVIANYTPVTDGTAEINTTMMPEGTTTITENGTHDVAQYATAHIQVLDDENLIPENIRDGVSIFGVEGIFNEHFALNENTVTGTIAGGSTTIGWYYRVANADGSIDMAHDLQNTTLQKELSCGLNEYIFIVQAKYGSIGFRIDTEKSKGIFVKTNNELKTYQIVKVTEPDFHIEVIYGAG